MLACMLVMPHMMAVHDYLLVCFRTQIDICTITSAAAVVSCTLFLFSLLCVLTGPPVSTAGTGSHSSSRVSKTAGKSVRESPDLIDQDLDVTDEPADEPAGSSRKRARTELASSSAVLQSQPKSAAIGEVQASAGLTAAPLGL